MKNLKEIIANIKLTKRNKIIIIIGIIILLAGGLITYKIISNNNLNKNLLIYQEKSYELYFLSSGLSGLIHSSLNDYIFDDKRYFNGNYCRENSDVVTAVQGYYSEKGIYDKLEKLYKEVKELNKEIKSSCSKSSSTYEIVSELYKSTKLLYDCAKSPSGNYQQYTQSINRGTNDFEIQFSDLEIEVGDFEKIKKEKIEKKIISYFIENKSSNNTIEESGFTIEESGLITESVTETYIE